MCKTDPVFLFVNAIFANFALIMVNIRLTLAAVCLAAAATSCDFSARSKSIDAAVRSVEAAMGEDKAGEGEHLQGADIGAGQAEGLEIPVTPKGLDEQVLRRKGYTASYNKTTLIPNWVAWQLTAEHTEGAAKRPRKAFHEDEDVPTPRATDDDYYNSGYDRGHMCPAGDNKWSEEAMYESFLFTNMCPQNSNLNRGDWNEMEQACRSWARRFGSIYIACGPILYKGRHKTIGRNKVVVPEAFFKVVLCMEGKPKAIGFIYKNAAGNRPKGDYVNTVDEVERVTGFDFFASLPDDVEKRVEADCDLAEWQH